MSEHWMPNPHEETMEDEMVEEMGDHLDLRRADQSSKPMTRMEYVEHLDRVREEGTATLEDFFPESHPEGFYELDGDLG